MKKMQKKELKKDIAEFKNKNTKEEIYEMAMHEKNVNELTEDVFSIFKKYLGKLEDEQISSNLVMCAISNLIHENLSLAENLEFCRFLQEHIFQFTIDILSEIENNKAK